MGRKVDLVGVAEVSEILGVTRQRVSGLNKEGRLPDPASTLRSGPVWHRADIERFLKKWDRSPGKHKPSS